MPTEQGKSQFKVATPSEVAEILKKEKSVRLVDVREEHEYEYCRIKGAQLCPLSRFLKAVEEAKLKKDEKIILYCHHGVRSARAAFLLAQQGYNNLTSMEGGIEAWSIEVDESVPRY